MSGTCPWCLGAAVVIDAAQLRAIIDGRSGLAVVPLLAALREDFPAWWCGTCHLGGVVLLDGLARVYGGACVGVGGG